MSNSAQYAVTVKQGFGTVTTADTSRTAPTVVSYIMPSGQLGTRVDHINLTAIGTTVASQVRLFLVPGWVGATISSITFVGATATVTTATNHGLATGFKVTIQGALPFNYNINDVAITVTGLTTFTYTMTTTPTTNATTVGYYIYNTATPTYQLWQEVAVSAVTPSASVSVYTSNLSTPNNTAIMPLWVPAGWSLRATVNDTQTSSGINIFANGGDF